MAPLTPDQISAYYDRIALAPIYRHLPGPELTTLLKSHDESLAFLSAIQRYSSAALPWENLSLHYDLHHKVHLDLAYLFDKIVTRGTGRGGYCMELNTLLLAVLETLGFKVRPCGAKVNEMCFAETHDTPRSELPYTGWSHMVLLVTLPGDTVLFDVGFGGGCPTGPIALRKGETRVNSEGSEDGSGQPHVLRVIKEEVDGNEMWVLDRLVHRPELPTEGVYRPLYAFTEMRFSPKDFAVMNHWISTARDSFFTYQIVMAKGVSSEDGERSIGNISLSGDSAKRRMYGHLVEERKLTSEKERIELLRDWFGITLSEVDQSGIRGLASMLHG